MRRSHAATIVAAAALPRLAVVAYERGDILAAFTEKSDDFARTFVASGTFGLVPGEPSAYTQPLYAFVLAPLYWAVGRSWLAVGLLQTAIAVAVALLVYAIGRRFLPAAAAVAAAVAASLNPYLVWHDVHVNREIVDQLAAAALVLALLAAADRRSWRLALAAGALSGLAILGNTRLVAVPLLAAGYLLWRRAGWAGAVAVVAGAALVVAPWVVRNRVEVGCLTVTTDAKALWKANNEATRGVLDRGGWIDEVPDPPGAPPTPEMAASLLERNGQRVAVDECAQMRLYRDRTLDFWREHPAEKARLAAQAARMLWDPRPTTTEGRPGQGTWRDDARRAQPVYTVALYAGALAGVAVASRVFAVLAVSLLAYQTLAALVFAGATRYRVAWDFLLALLAAAALAALARRRR